MHCYMILQFCWSFSYFCSFKNMLLDSRHQIKVIPMFKKAYHYVISNFIKQNDYRYNVFLIKVSFPKVPSKEVHV